MSTCWRFKRIKPAHLSMVNDQLEERVHQQDSIWQDTAAVKEDGLWRNTRWSNSSDTGTRCVWLLSLTTVWRVWGWPLVVHGRSTSRGWAGSWSGTVSGPASQSGACNRTTRRGCCWKPAGRATAAGGTWTAGGGEEKVSYTNVPMQANTNVYRVRSVNMIGKTAT